MPDINLKSIQKGAKAGARNAIVGGAAGYKSGAQKAEQEGKSPTGQIKSGLGQGIRGAVGRGSWGAKKAYWDEKNKNQKIPTQDLRTVGKFAQGAAAKAAKAAGNSVGGPVAGWAAEQAVKHPRETLEIIFAILLVMFLPTLFLIYLFFGNAVGEQAKQQQQQNQQGQQANPLQVTKTGPAVAKQGDSITYTITVTDAQNATEITITDPLPKGTTYKSSTKNGILSPDGSTVTWDIKNPPNPVNVTVSLVLTATQDNTNIINIASAQVLGAAGGGCGSFDKTATSFDALMAGQGRCVTVLGNENQFVAAVIKNAGTQLGLSGKESQLHAIYQKATASNVNPLIVTAIWGVEAGWSTNGTEFGCKPFGSGFTAQLTCSVNTLNQWMTYYEQQKTKPVKLTANCVYSDPFLFAYEKYTPVCAISDNNSNARKNFASYYRQLMGQ